MARLDHAKAEKLFVFKNRIAEVRFIFVESTF